MYKIHLHKNVKAMILILIVSIFLLVPLLIHQTGILGIDSYFQLNRVYEAAMQLKHHNFSFLNLYSFQQSGRIVNELYSPLVGYVFGLILLISGSWFKFQIISNIIIFFLAGISFYSATNKLRLPFKASIATAVLYMTSISVSGYLYGGNWRALAMAVIPLLIIPMVDFYNANLSLKPLLEGGIIVALVAQMQLVTMILAVPVIIVTFLIGFLRSNEKLKVFLNGLLSFIVVIILSLNVILPYLELTKNNTILPPVAMNLDKVTLDVIVPQTGRFDLTICGAVFYLAIAGLIIFWGKISLITKMISIFGIVYIILGTSLLPWRGIGEHFINLQNFLQMPIRFSLIGIPFLYIGALALFFEVANSEQSNSLEQVINYIAVLLSLMSVGSFMLTLNNRAKEFKSPELNIVKALDTSDANAIVGQYRGEQLHVAPDLQQLMHIRDLSGLITSVDRISPDYLPVPYADYNKVDFYREYRKAVAEQRTDYQHVVKTNGVLELRWQAEKSGTQNVPAVAYYRTKVKLNNHEIKPSQRKISDVGSLQVDQKQGENVLSLQYVPAKSTMIGVLLATFGWGVALIAVAILSIRKRSEY